MAIVIAEAADTFSGTFRILATKWGGPITTTVIGGIADNTGVRYALTCFVRTVRIADARHTFRAIIAIDTKRRIVSTSIIVIGVTDLTGTGHTGRGIIAAIVVT